MDLNNTFNQSKFEEYSVYLKKNGLSNTSLKRKLSSLTSFQKFLSRKKLITRNNLLESKENNVVNFDKDKAFISVIKTIFPFKKKRY